MTGARYGSRAVMLRFGTWPTAMRVTSRFIELHKAIWDVLREEVLKGYAQQKRAA